MQLRDTSTGLASADVQSATQNVIIRRVASAYRYIDVEPLTPEIGATVIGVDLSKPLQDGIVQEVHDAWMRHLVLFMRDQHMTPAQHLAFGRHFGDLHIHPAAPYANGDPALMVIHTDKDSRRNNGSGWHSDVSADGEPPLGSILHLHRVPSHGGDTLFANMYAAYETLSELIRDLLDGLTARHESDYSGYYGDHPPQREFPRASHPVVRTHPVTKRKALFVNAGFTRRIEGVSRPESDALLRLLFEHVKNPAFHCRFRWEPHSLAMWDNRCVQHMAVWDYHPETRSGLRVTVKGERPFH